MAEQFALEQRLGEGRTVDRHQGLGRAGAVAVDGARHQLLARATLALNKDRGVGGRHPANEVVDFAHAGSCAHHVVFQRNFRPQRLIFFAHLIPMAQVPERQAGQAGHRRDQLQMSFVEALGSAVEINDRRHLARDQQWHTEN